MKKQLSNIQLLLLFIAFSIFLGGCDFKFIQSGNDQTPTPVLGEKVRNEGNGVYDLYDDELIKTAEDKQIVLFFSADWCAECNNLDNDILTNKDKIPQNVIIMKVEYDVRKDLKDKYKVTKENSLIEINSAEEKLKDIGTKKTLSEILKSI
ncbi:hypothetical protein KBD45_08080 [Candidatus Dojkabacteria bacterium]|nr:hypothetical protein [Candidatus Dojkabacteria bacterium]